MSSKFVCNNAYKNLTSSRIVQLVSFVVFTFLLFGCAAPRVTVNPDMQVEDYKDYKIVYLPTPESDQDDPRNIFPQVVERLEGLGFIVRPISEENLIEGAQGTGFVVDPKGFILTCAHLFEKEDEASIWIKEQDMRQMWLILTRRKISHY
ncbi:MAG: hypothetical protein SV375_17535 [Thermodesulfobacteriota bacterium]|nr:hypothetical protein [Thermodesulfobacteriota bacterium]